MVGSELARVLNGKHPSCYTEKPEQEGSQTSAGYTSTHPTIVKLATFTVRVEDPLVENF